MTLTFEILYALNAFYLINILTIYMFEWKTFCVTTNIFYTTEHTTFYIQSQCITLPIWPTLLNGWPYVINFLASLRMLLYNSSLVLGTSGEVDLYDAYSYNTSKTIEKRLWKVETIRDNSQLSTQYRNNSCLKNIFITDVFKFFYKFRVGAGRNNFENHCCTLTSKDYQKNSTVINQSLIQLCQTYVSEYTVFEWSRTWHKP